MARIVFGQLAIAVVTALIAVLLGGKAAGISSMLAGVSCVVPNAVFAFGLGLSDRKANKPGSFFKWELVKVLLTIVLMVAGFWLYQDMKWLAFFVSFIVLLKSYLFLLHKFKY